MGRRLPALIVAPVAADRPNAPAGVRVPFWAHQLAEMLLGVVLLFEGARTGTHVAVVVVGVVLILFSLMTEGPLCAWPVIPRKLHRVGDVVFAVVLVASPLLLGIDESIADDEGAEHRTRRRPLPR